MKKTLLTLSLLLMLFASNSIAQCNAFIFYSVTNSPVVQFWDSSAGTQGPVSYLLDFGDGMTSTLQTDTHTYAYGNYNVCLTITDSTGCTDTYCDSLFLPDPFPLGIGGYLHVDTMFQYSCTAPTPIPFNYYINQYNFSYTDTLIAYIQFGDGTDTTFLVTNLSSGSWFQGTITHAFANAGTYNAQMTVTGPQNIVSSFQPWTPIVIASTCGNISGRVYNDLNGNCVYDAGEGVEWVYVYIDNGGMMAGFATTDTGGYYSFTVPTASTYNIHIDQGGIYARYIPSCPSSGSLTVSTVPSSGNDFGVVCPAAFDLQGSVHSHRIRPGKTELIHVFVYNQFCNTPNGQIEVTIDPLLTPLPDTGSLGYTIVGNSVILPFTPYEHRWAFGIPVDVDSSAQIGDTVCITVSITPITGDLVPANNIFTYCFPIATSYDPNDKVAIPKGNGSAGYVAPDITLNYTVRFQNTGNAYAENVYILDTLDASLDPMSVEVIATSHAMSYAMLTGNIMRFTFDNIMLDDSTTNEPGSHGYVSYRVTMKPNLAQFTEILNTAGIYFDFNPPVMTNTTLHTIDNALAVKEIENNSLISLYPNPSHDKCYMYFKDNRRKSITMVDALGKEVLNETISADTYVMNTSKLVAGIYTIRIVDDNKNTDAYKLIIN